MSSGARRAGRVAGALAGVSLVLLSALLPASSAVASRRVSRTMIVLTGGASAYPEATTMLAASSGAFVFSNQPRGASGELLPSSTLHASLWKTQTKSVPLAVPTAGTRIPDPLKDVSVSGSMVSVLEEGISHPKNFWVLTEYLPTGKVVTSKLPAAGVWQGASRDGYVMTVTTGKSSSPATTVYDVAQGGSPVQIGEEAITGYDVHVLAGPDAIVVSYWAKPQFVVEYTVYQGKSPWQGLYRGNGSWTCTSVTADWAGCYDVVSSGGTTNTALYGFSLRQQAPIEPMSPLPGNPPDLRVLPTANALYWSYCSTGSSSCTLTRMLDSSPGTESFSVPTPDVVAADEEAAWGAAAPGSGASSSGIFAVTETGTSPVQLVAAPLSPLSVAAVSVSSGSPASVTYVDNGSGGLGVYRSSVTDVSGRPLTVGPATLIGSIEYVAPDGPASPVSLADGAQSVAYSVDSASGSGSSVGLTAWTQSRQMAITSAAPTSNALSVWANWVSWLGDGICHLYDLSTGQASTLNLSELGACAVGDGELAWAGSGGGIYMVKMTSRGPEPTSKASAILGPRRGQRLVGTGHLYLAPQFIGWDLPYVASGSTGGSTAAGYRDYQTMTPPVTLGAGRDVDAISDLYLVQSWTGGLDPSVRSLMTGKLIHLGSSSVSVSLSGDLVVWVGTDGQARLEQLPG